MALLWSRTWHESYPSHKTPLSLSSCFLTLAESLVALYDSLLALPWSRTRHESFSAHRTPMSLSPYSLARTESPVAP